MIIDIKELRVGNQLLNGVVTHIYQHEVRVFDGYTFWSSRKVDFEPALITVGVLSATGSELRWNTMRIEINSNVSMTWSDGVFDLGDYLEFSHIKYVHQLQNLYFMLTNKELPI